jgi:hypothetical protein
MGSLSLRESLIGAWELVSAVKRDAETGVGTHMLGERLRGQRVVSTLQRTSINAVTALVFGTVSVSAGELPKYEVGGFPVSPVQIAVLGSNRVQEQSPTPTLALNGMPASPLQIAVLHRQTKLLTAGKLNKDHTSD